MFACLRCWFSSRISGLGYVSPKSFSDLTGIFVLRYISISTFPDCVREGTSGRALGGTAVLQQYLLRRADILAIPSLLLQVMRASSMTSTVVIGRVSFSTMLDADVTDPDRKPRARVHQRLTSGCSALSLCFSRSLYMVLLATFLALVLFFWLELFSDLAAGNMQVGVSPRALVRR